MRRMPIEPSPTERCERVALAVMGGKSNRAIAAKLGVDEATVRRDRRFLSTPLEQRPVKVKKPGKVKPVRELSPDELHDLRLKELLKLAQEWVVQQHLVLPEIEDVLHEAGKRMHRDRAHVMRLPNRSETASELLALAKPKRMAEECMSAKLDFVSSGSASGWRAVCHGRKCCKI
jgi:transposase